MSRFGIARWICAAALLAAPAARADEEDDDMPTITVSGEGKVSAVPDIAEISVGVISQAPTAEGALAANNQSMAALQAILTERGVAAKDIQTSQISVSPQYSQPVQVMPQPRAGAPGQEPREFVPRIVGYQVTNTVQVTARKIDKLGPTLDAMVKAGANQIYGISFRVDQSDKLLDQARKDAVGAAKRKAELMAGELGVVVGPPRRINESGGFVPPPAPMMRYGRAMMAAAPEASMPVAPGEQELRVSVQVVFELRQAK